jgi:hypothetical protein
MAIVESLESLNANCFNCFQSNNSYNVYNFPIFIVISGVFQTLNLSGLILIVKFKFILCMVYVLKLAFLFIFEVHVIGVFS